jgi:hypothetical protein
MRLAKSKCLYAIRERGWLYPQQIGRTTLSGYLPVRLSQGCSNILLLQGTNLLLSQHPIITCPTAIFNACRVACFFRQRQVQPQIISFGKNDGSLYYVF